MKKNILLNLLLIFTVSLSAQTGPGGVGNSSSNVVWLQPDKIAGLADGDDILTWSDQSGNGNDVSQPTATLSPILKTNITNGQAVVRFNKVDGRIRRPNFTGFPTTEITEIYVNKTTDSGDGILSYASAGGNNDFLLFSSNNIGLYRNSVVSTGLSVNDNAFHIVNVSWKSTGGQEEGWKDGINSFNNTGHVAGSSITAGGSFAIAGEQDAPDANYDAGQAHFGDFGEVIVFNTYLNKAQHIIISNYLAAKYGLTLADNDFYNEDDVANGNYDNEVAGIGRVDASNIHDDARGSAIVEILNPSNLDDDEFLHWGHDNGIQQATEYSDVPAGVQGRFERVWRASEVNSSNTAVDVGTIDVVFDLTGLGTVTPSDLRLLVDTDNDGSFSDETPISGATSAGGNSYQFSGVSAIEDNLRFTLATINLSQTPLPVELVSFTALPTEDKFVKIDWKTATEINNDFFTVEKSSNGKEWSKVANVDGAGNSKSIETYSIVDESPLKNISYYRLKQTDFDGKFEYSEIRTVNLQERSSEINIYPNPANTNFIIEGDVSELADIQIFNVIGQNVNHLIEKNEINTNKLNINISQLNEGIYYVRTKTQVQRIYKK